ncbi:MAG TPA: hypothetical protein VJ044_03745 [Candidatus Hodarchaeales archaeon]|nr:hypothetical protein [Candidatus Hodarchaeales archaeon]HLC84534.1 hypothetical protein [Candidatus Nanoarchaeia archaeon]
MAKPLSAEERNKAIVKILRKHEKRKAELNQSIKESLEELKNNEVRQSLERIEQHVEGLKKIAAKLDLI